MAYYPDGRRKLVVAGGAIAQTTLTATSVLLDLDTMVWSNGPNLPMAINMALAVPYKDSFIIVGGVTPGGSNAQHNIFEFNVNTESFDFRGESIQISRYHHWAFLVPDEAVNC